MLQRHYAHSLPGRPEAEWHGLEEHLGATACLASCFASSFHSGQWAYLAGLWHDLGKFQPRFQERLRGARESVEHSGAGAAHAMVQHGIGATPLAFVIAGHHAGLAAPVPLMQRVELNKEVCRSLAPIVPQHILNHGLPTRPAFLENGDREDQRRHLEFWIRLLFSCLADADYLDTELALDPGRAAARPQEFDIGGLLPLIEAAISKRRASGAPMQAARDAVVQACRAAAEWSPGLFSLTAPTGAGKTLASMLFAVRHAAAHREKHGFRRIIVVLPYTSIIEQNAKVYRDVFGDGVVLEHHSNLDLSAEVERKGHELTETHKLASENWDAPLIVTTTVQFFESIFSNRTSRCRKLHNIARSVIILDEVQSLPPGYLPSILDALRELTSSYGCSVVLSTATPPALCDRPSFSGGLRHVREMIPDRSQLAGTLRRVKYHWPEKAEPEDWDSLATRIASHPRALTVVHLRNDARLLSEKLSSLRPNERVCHLSAAMCPKHRKEVLLEVHSMLDHGQSCQLVSTQLIEAGVDIDFPVLFRAMAGIDSIVQAAGRCNREGNSSWGDVHIFEAPTQPPPGVLRQGIDATRLLLAVHGASIDPSDPAVCDEYFRALYGLAARDSKGIQADRIALDFTSVAAKFKLIEDGCTATIVVPYKGSDGPLRGVERPDRPLRERIRALQPFTVRIYPQAFARLKAAGAIGEVLPGGDIYRLLPAFHHLYDDRFGLVLGPDIVPDPSRYVV